MGEALRCGEAGHFLFQFRQRVVGLAGADNPGALSDLELGATGHEFPLRAGAKDGIASALFVLLGGLEKKGRLVLAGDFGESGHWGLAVRHQFGPDRHDAVLRGEGCEFFGAGMNVGRRHAEQAGGLRTRVACGQARARKRWKRDMGITEDREETNRSRVAGNGEIYGAGTSASRDLTRQGPGRPGTSRIGTQPRRLKAAAVRAASRSAT